jgi:hypothetical protein
MWSWLEQEGMTEAEAGVAGGLATGLFMAPWGVTRSPDLDRTAAALHPGAKERR